MRIKIKENKIMKEKKKVVFKVLACRICGEQGVLRKYKKNSKVQKNYQCSIDFRHTLNEYSVPFSMKLEEEITPPMCGKIIRAFDAKKKNSIHYYGILESWVSIDNKFTLVVNTGSELIIIQNSSWKYLKEV